MSDSKAAEPLDLAASAEARPAAPSAGQGRRVRRLNLRWGGIHTRARGLLGRAMKVAVPASQVSFASAPATIAAPEARPQ